MISALFPLAFLGLGPTELIVILVILLLLFGGSKLPSLAKGLGQSIKEFKQASRDEPAADKKPEAKTDSKSGNN
jgi:sec-independent protein translocase protein TatA